MTICARPHECIETSEPSNNLRSSRSVSRETAPEVRTSGFFTGVLIQLSRLARSDAPPSAGKGTAAYPGFLV